MRSSVISRHLVCHRREVCDVVLAGRIRPKVFQCVDNGGVLIFLRVVGAVFRGDAPIYGIEDHDEFEPLLAVPVHLGRAEEMLQCFIPSRIRHVLVELDGDLELLRYQLC